MLVEIRLENFKSYAGKQKIGPFFNFTSIIGPNGSGKSNLMDAVSFVLGVKSSHLRSSHLSELIHKPSDPSIEVPKKATVEALYQKDGEATLFSRSVTDSGVSEYKINGRAVSFAKYNALLEGENILVKARNFLVFQVSLCDLSIVWSPLLSASIAVLICIFRLFGLINYFNSSPFPLQGDVEAIASQSPKDLTRLIEQISGSLDLKDEYESLKALTERTTEYSAFNFTKKKGVAAEMKVFKEQKEEAVRYQKLSEDKVCPILAVKLSLNCQDNLMVRFLLWKLFHSEKSIKDLVAEIQAEKENMGEFTEKQSELDNELQTKKQSQAKVEKELLKLEKKQKERETALSSLNPKKLKVEEKVKYHAKKLNDTKSNLETANQAFERKNELVAKLQNERDTVKRAFDQFEAGAKKKTSKAISDAAVAEYETLKETANAQSAEDRAQLSKLDSELKMRQDALAVVQDKVSSAEKRKDELHDEKQSQEDRKKQVGHFIFFGLINIG